MASTLVANPNLEAALWLWQVTFFLAPTLFLRLGSEVR
jgi:hypothetical protein